MKLSDLNLKDGCKLKLNNIAIMLELSKEARIRVYPDQDISQIVRLLNLAVESNDQPVKDHLEKFANYIDQDVLAFFKVLGVDLSIYRPALDDSGKSTLVGVMQKNLRHDSKIEVT